MGNLIADAHQVATTAPTSPSPRVAVSAATPSIRRAPCFTRKDIFTELPFGNVTTVTEITGADLLAAPRERLQPDRGRVQAASRRSRASPSRSMPTKPAGSRVRLGAGQRRSRSIRPSKYKVATNDYMMAGGDGYTALSNGKVLIDKSGGQPDGVGRDRLHHRRQDRLPSGRRPYRHQEVDGTPQRPG